MYFKVVAPPSSGITMGKMHGQIKSMKGHSVAMGNTNKMERDVKSIS